MVQYARRHTVSFPTKKSCGVWHDSSCFCSSGNEKNSEIPRRRDFSFHPLPYGSVVQMAEQRTVNPLGVGSIPTRSVYAGVIQWQERCPVNSLLGVRVLSPASKCRQFPVRPRRVGGCRKVAESREPTHRWFRLGYNTPSCGSIPQSVTNPERGIQHTLCVYLQFFSRLCGDPAEWWDPLYYRFTSGMSVLPMR